MASTPPKEETLDDVEGATSCLEKLDIKEQEQQRIITCFEKCAFKEGDAFHAKVTQIYDPSKFWMVIKYQELDIYQKYLFRLYYKEKGKYKLRKEQIKKGLYVVAFDDGGFYRGVVVGFPCDNSPDPGAMIYFFDYGMVKTIDFDNLFQLDEKSYGAPQFAVRAALFQVRPRNTHIWTVESVNAFQSLVNDKNLIGVIQGIDEERQTLYVDLLEEGSNSKFQPIHESLISLRHARSLSEESAIVKDKSVEPKVNYPYLFPSHHILEGAILPTSLYDNEYFLQYTSDAHVMNRYYKYTKKAKKRDGKKN